MDDQMNVASPTEEDLLALVLEARNIRVEEAARKFGVQPSVINQLASELEKKGLLEIRDKGSSDVLLSVTYDSLKKVKLLEKELVKKYKTPEKEEKKKPSPAETLKKTRTFGWDLIFLLLVLLCIRYLGLFADNPKDAMNFLIAVILFFVAVLIYNRKKNLMHTRSVIAKMKLVIHLVITYPGENKKHVTSFIILVLATFFTGRFLSSPEHEIYNLIVAVLLLAGIVVIYRSKASPSTKFRFYMGMLFIVYSMMLLAGITSLTDFLFGSRERTYDSFVGFALLMILYLNRGTLGLGKISLTQLFERKSETGLRKIR